MNVDNHNSDDSHETKSKYSFRKMVTIVFGAEMNLFLFCVSYSMFLPAQQNFLYQSICMYKFASHKVCSQLDTSPALQYAEDKIQADFSIFSTISSLCSSLPALIVTLILGNWCDKLSFRIPMIIPHIGMIGICICYIVIDFFDMSAFNPIYLGFLSIIMGVCGSGGSVIVVVASYVSKTSSLSSRTTRLAAIEGGFSVGAMVGSLINAALIKYGALHVFACQIGIHIYSICLILTMIEELHSWELVKERVELESNGSWCSFLLPDFAVFQGFSIFFVKNTKYCNIQPYLLAMGYVFVINAALINSVAGVSYEFFTLQPISMSPVMYGIYQAVNSCLVSVMLLIGMRLLRKYCSMSDAGFVVIGLLSRIVSSFVLAFGDFYPQIVPWLYSICNCLVFYVYVAMRSGLTKLVDQSDHGKLLAALSFFENSLGLILTVGVNYLYGTLVSSNYDVPFVKYLLNGYLFMVVGIVCCTLLSLTIWLGKKNLNNWQFNYLPVC